MGCVVDLHHRLPHAGILPPTRVNTPEPEDQQQDADQPHVDETNGYASGPAQGHSAVTYEQIKLTKMTKLTNLTNPGGARDDLDGGGSGGAQAGGAAPPGDDAPDSWDTSSMETEDYHATRDAEWQADGGGGDGGDGDARSAARLYSRGRASDARGEALPSVGECVNCNRVGPRNPDGRCRDVCGKALRRMQGMKCAKGAWSEQRFHFDKSRDVRDVVDHAVRIKLAKDPGFFETDLWKLPQRGKGVERMEELFDGETIRSVYERSRPTRK